MVHVIDASVAIKWFVQEPGRESALKWLAKVLERPRAFAVPELFYFEMSSVFFRVVPRPTAQQRHLFERTLHFGWQRFAFTPELLAQMEFCREYGLTGYDAAYVGLARLLKGRWVTADAKAHRAIEKLQLSELLQAD